MNFLNKKLTHRDYQCLEYVIIAYFNHLFLLPLALKTTTFTMNQSPELKNWQIVAVLLSRQDMEWECFFRTWADKLWSTKAVVPSSSELV